jgi:predicted nucleic acid-binding protein
VTAERSAGSLDAVIDDGDEVVIAVITAAELLVGDLAEGKSKRRRRGS